MKLEVLPSSEASLREAAPAARRADEICHQQCHIYDYYRNIKVIFRSAPCSAIQETSINVIYSPASVCVCVVPACE